MKNGVFAEQLRAFLEKASLRGRRLEVFLEAAGINPGRMKYWKRGSNLPSPENWRGFCLVARQALPPESEGGNDLELLDEQFRKYSALAFEAQRSGKSSKHRLETQDQKRQQSSSLSAQARANATPRFAPVRTGLNELISAAGLSAFYPSRDYYSRYLDAASVDQYVSTAKCSVVLVSINLMTGIPIDGVCDALIRNLKTNPKFTATVSLLNPDVPHLMATLAPVLSTKPDDLAHSIRQSLNQLNDARTQLRPKDRGRFSIRVHDTIPMGSAILIDHNELFGRIQIESKVYKAPPRKSFAFEVVRTGVEGFYETVAKGYDDLVADGHGWAIVHSGKKKLTRAVE
jgi:uncharacterized protein YdeI (YjbR/CyaY-like superfamily)